MLVTAERMNLDNIMVVHSSQLEQFQYYFEIKASITSIYIVRTTLYILTSLSNKAPSYITTIHLTGGFQAHSIPVCTIYLY
jgi:hypothetical protein